MSFIPSYQAPQSSTGATWEATDHPHLCGQTNERLTVMQVQGELRIAHCGGFHSSLNLLIRAVNVVAKLLGHPIHWDTETVGCNPSLSSIPVREQRSLADALSEIAAWLARPTAAHDLVIIFLDDQPDIQTWVCHLAQLCPR